MAAKDPDEAALARLSEEAALARLSEERDRVLLETPSRRLPVPTTVNAVLPCPDCGQVATVEARLFVRRTRDSDGTTTLTLRTRAPKVAHNCDQAELGLASGPLSR